MLDTKKIKKDFPILSRKIGNNKLVYLDNAATSQKPKVVLDAITDFYSVHNSNVHRGIHTLSEEATDMYEKSREIVADFINSSDSKEIIFTKGTTESINFIASTLGDSVIKKGDSILVTELEHHSNLVPWQILANKKKAKLEFVEVSTEGEIEFSDFEKKINNNVKIVAVTHASNVLGTILPIKKITEIAHKHGAYVIVDGAQAAPHLPVDVPFLGCDVYTFSAHKMLGPTGVGVLWVKKDILQKIEPYQFGGGMINDVSLSGATWAGIPERFEAGTPNISGVVAFASALNYLSKIGMQNIFKHETELTKYIVNALGKIDNLKLYGPKDPLSRTGLFSFTIKNTHAHDVASILNSLGVAVRSGHHCAQPLHKKLKEAATVRASFYFYNDKDDANNLIEAIKKAKEILG